MTDLELLAAARAGDEAAANALVERYRRLAGILANPFFIEGADRDDVVQEALLGLTHAIRGYQPSVGEFAPFAYVCMRRRIVTAVKRGRAWKHQHLNGSLRQLTDSDGDPTAAVELIADGGADPADILVAREQLAAIARGLKTLTPLERRCLTGYMNGVSYRDIAGPGETHRTVDNALQRARMKLRDAA